MISACPSILQKKKEELVLPISHGVLSSREWKEGQVLYIHAGKSNGLWISAENQASLISALDAAADAAISATNNAHDQLTKGISGQTST